MVIVKAGGESEGGAMPDESMFAEMGRYNEELAEAGILLEAEGLMPSSTGKRVRFDGDDQTVIDGPFPETKDLVAGYWVWRVGSIEEAVDWLKKAPFGWGTEVGIRQGAEAEDLGESFTPELREQETRIHEMADKNKAA